MTGKPRVSPEKMVTLAWHCLLIGSYFEPLQLTSKAKQNIKQAVIEAKHQVMAGQLERLADQVLRQARQQFLMWK